MSNSEERVMSEVEGAGAEEEEDLEVEEILDCRRVNGKDLYLLKWKGFTEEHNSWEPEENLGCPELLEAFKAKQQLKKEAPRVSGPKKVRRSKEVKDRRASKDLKDRRDSNDLKDRRDSQDDEQKPQLQPVEADDTSNVTPPAKKKKVNKLEKDDSIDQYETKQISMVSSDVKTKQTSKMISNNKIKQIPKVVITAKDDAKPRGFDRGLEAEKILGATDCLGGLQFLMKWKGSEDADLVEAQQANQICPQVVIRFYEERLTWHSTQEFTAKV